MSSFDESVAPPLHAALTREMGSAAQPMPSSSEDGSAVLELKPETLSLVPSAATSAAPSPSPAHSPNRHGRGGNKPQALADLAQQGANSNNTLVTTAAVGGLVAPSASLNTPLALFMKQHRLQMYTANLVANGFEELEDLPVLCRSDATNRELLAAIIPLPGHQAKFLRVVSEYNATTLSKRKKAMRMSNNDLMSLGGRGGGGGGAGSGGEFASIHQSGSNNYQNNNNAGGSFNAFEIGTPSSFDGVDGGSRLLGHSSNGNNNGMLSDEDDNNSNRLLYHPETLSATAPRRGPSQQQRLAVRHRGMRASSSELSSGVVGVSSPVFDPSSNLFASPVGAVSTAPYFNNEDRMSSPLHNPTLPKNASADFSTPPPPSQAPANAITSAKTFAASSSNFHFGAAGNNNNNNNANSSHTPSSSHPTTPRSFHHPTTDTNVHMNVKPPSSSKSNFVPPTSRDVYVNSRDTDFGMTKRIVVRRYADLKIVVVGQGGVGKTALIHRLCNQTFNSRIKCTIGVEFTSKTVHITRYFTAPKKDGLIAQGKEFEIITDVNLQFWDIAGQEDCGNATRTYYHGAKAAIIVYDATDPYSLTTAIRWKRDLENKVKFGGGNSVLDVPTILVANKIDAMPYVLPLKRRIGGGGGGGRTSTASTPTSSKGGGGGEFPVPQQKQNGGSALSRAPSEPSEQRLGATATSTSQTSLNILPPQEYDEKDFNSNHTVLSLPETSEDVQNLINAFRFTGHYFVSAKSGARVEEMCNFVVTCILKMDPHGTDEVPQAILNNPELAAARTAAGFAQNVASPSPLRGRIEIVQKPQKKKKSGFKCVI